MLDSTCSEYSTTTYIGFTTILSHIPASSLPPPCHVDTALGTTAGVCLTGRGPFILTFPLLHLPPMVGRCPFDATVMGLYNRWVEPGMEPYIHILSLVTNHLLAKVMFLPTLSYSPTFPLCFHYIFPLLLYISIFTSTSTVQPLLLLFSCATDAWSGPALGLLSPPNTCHQTLHHQHSLQWLPLYQTLIQPTSYLFPTLPPLSQTFRRLPTRHSGSDWLAAVA